MKQNRVIKNASWIIGCRIVQSVFALVISMMTARYLGPSNFGLINYAQSLVTFVVPIMQLGLNLTIVHEIVLNPEKEGEILGTSMLLNFIMSFITIGGVIVFVLIANAGETETLIVCVLYSTLLIAQSIEIVQYWFQAKLMSKYTSIVMLVAYVIVSSYKIYLLITNKTIYWFAISNCLDYLLIAVMLLFLYYKLGNQKLSFCWKTAKDLFSRSKHYIISSLMVAIFAQTDRIMLKLMINDSATGYYSAAIGCAGLTSFVFVAIIDSARPSIFENKKLNSQDFEKNISRLFSVIIFFSLAQSVFMTIFSKYIIRILYGKDFYPSINALKIVVWYTTFSYLGSVRNVWILAEKKQKVLWILNLCGALMNIVLNFFLIPIWGINGAAIASLITQVFTNVIMNQIIKDIRPVNKLMLKSCNPKYLIEMIKIFLKKSEKIK